MDILFGLLFVAAIWLTPAVIAFWIGRNTAPIQAPRNSRQLDAIVALDRLRRERRIGPMAYREVRQQWAADCRSIGVLLPPAVDAPEPTPTSLAPQMESGGAGASVEVTAGEKTRSSPLDTETPSSAAVESERSDTDIVFVPPQRMTPGAETPTTASAPPVPTTPASQSPEIVDAQLVDEPVTSPAASASRTQLAKPAPWDIPDSPSEPRSPQRTWGELLQSFMEEKNIRWGELLSGILIVGSAAGLVLSLRDQLQQTIPYFPSLMFLLLIGAVHAAGNYTYRRWKLETTSRGVLVIGMMLVPVGLLAACLLSGKGEVRSVTDPLYITAVAVGLGGYGAMCWWSSRILLPAHATAMTISVLGASASTLLIHRLGSTGDSVTAMWLGLAPLAFAMFAPWRYVSAGHASRDGEQAGEVATWDSAECESFALSVALPAFATALGIGYLTHLTGGLFSASRVASPALTATFCAVATAGIAWQRRSRDVRWETTGAATVIAGIVLAALSIASSWPMPLSWLMSTGLAFGILFATGLRHNNALLVGGGLVTLVPGWIVGTHLLLGNLAIDQAMTGAPLLSSASALSLSLLMVVLSATAVWQRAQQRERISQTLFVGAGAVGLTGLALALLASVQTGAFFDAQVATALFATYGVAALLGSSLVAERGTAQAIVGGGALLTVIACFQATMGETPLLSIQWIKHQGATALSLFSWLLGAIATLHYFWRPRAQMELEARSSIANVVANYALGGAILAIGASYFPSPPTLATQCYLWWNGTIIALLASVLQRLEAGLGSRLETGLAEGQETGRAVDDEPSAMLYRLFECLSCVAVAISAITVVHSNQPDIFATRTGAWLLDGRVFQWMAFSLTIWVGAISLARRCTQPTLLATLSKPSIANSLLGILFIALCGHSLLAVAPGWQAEFRGASIDISRWTHLTGLAIASMALVGLLIAERLRRSNAPIGFEAIGLLVVFVCVRLAALSATPANAASWLAAVATSLAAIGIWQREQLGRVWRAVGGDPVNARQSRYLAAMMIAASTIVALLSSVSMLRSAGWQSAMGAPGEPTYTQGILRQAGPIALLAMASLAHGTLLGVSHFSLVGGALVVTGTTLSVLNISLADGFSYVDVALLLQWNTITGAIWGWLWAAARWASSTQIDRDADGRDSPRASAEAWHGWLAAISVLPLAIAGWILLKIVVAPQGAIEITSLLSHWASWVGLALIGGLTIFGSRNHRQEVAGLLWGGLGIAAVALVAARLDAADVARTWSAYHGLMAGMCLLAGLMTVGVCLVSSRRVGAELSQRVSTDSLTHGVLGLIALIYAMCWRATWGDPAVDGWSAWSLGGLTFVVATLAFRSKQQGMVGLSALLAATSTWFATHNLAPTHVAWTRPWIAVLVVSSVWAVLVRLAGESKTFIAQWAAPSRLTESQFHRRVRWAGAMAALLFSIVLPLQLPARVLVTAETWHWWSVVVFQLLLALVCLWDVRISRRLKPLFLTGLAVLLSLNPLLPGHARLAATALALALYLAITAAMWRQREAWQRLLRRWGSPNDSGAPAATWLAPTVVAGSVLLTVFSLSVLLTGDQRWERFAMAGVALCGALAVSRFAGQTVTASTETDARISVTRRLKLHHLSLALGVISVTWASWADIELSHATIWLERLVRAVSMLSLSALVLGAVVPRWLRPQASWRDASRNVFLGCVAGAVGMFVGLLALEWQWFDPVHGAPLSALQVGSILVFMGGLVIALVAVAVLPERDPLHLSDAARVTYAYAAQALAALLVLHMYLCVPTLFNNWGGYWPYVVMGIAFLGAGAGEVLQRSGIKVLGDPFVRTSLLLPLAPLLGMLVSDSAGSYTAVMAGTALLFALAAMAGRSWICGALAVVLGNATLWSFYREWNWFSFAQNPQVWLIPPAASVLVAAQFYRHRLKPEQLAFLRYISIAMIYISSTSELFIHGLGESLWPPMVLASLSVLGVLAGIGMRIRAFLYFGSSFLLMSIVAMVSHAGRAIGHVWPWWAFGITLGIVILVMFGLFEKRRDDMQRLLSELRTWDN